ncbi:hypothetical protein [Formosa maritima]|uniref:DUF3828 domain-containing protein n=1 Tax=Formosa maritima TaxID=2592046 RepID=A0A5D0GJF0_9FLAO|nr:hypothetical protein [Formosa maritima]TYA59063.1 hypothetical protein FVF61_02630 [Formosa maritima]
MKNLSFNILVVLILLTQSSFSQYSKIDLSTISEEKKQEVYEFVYQALTTCDEAPSFTSKKTTYDFRKFYDDNKISSHCKWQEERYGSIASIILDEVIFRNDKEVFRYKVKRSKADWLSEIRIFIDKKGRFTSINTKSYWSDTFYTWGEHPKPFVVDISIVQDSIVKQNNEFALKSYNLCENSEIFELNETNAIYRTIRKDWKKYMLKECDSIKQTHGNFKKLQFSQYLTDSIGFKVYRYQVDFDKMKKPSEIRIYSKLNDKYSGIFVVDVWYDKYFSLKEAREKSRNELGN